MSTHATIGYKNADGTVVSAYVHYDGYIKNVGRVLKTFTDFNSVKDFVDLGGRSEIDSGFYTDRGEDLELYTNQYEKEYWDDDCISFLYLFKDNEWWVKECGDDEAFKLK